MKKFRVRFYGKIQKRISDLGSMVLQRQKNAKTIIFHDNANKQTHSCVQILKTKKK